MHQPGEPSSPAHAPVSRPARASGPRRYDLSGEPELQLAEVIDLIGNQERAGPSARFRTAAVLGIAVPALLIAAGSFFVGSAVQTRCLHLDGGLGACDPLQQIAAVTIIGQLVILGATMGALLWSRRLPLEQRHVGGIYLAIASSVGWALITSLFAALWMSGNP